jgi:hypothetical protein
MRSLIAEVGSATAVVAAAKYSQEQPVLRR